MAAVLPNSFEREIECSICHDPFEDPRWLSCFHTFCFECVQRLAEGSSSVLCPLCRKKTALPSNGAMGLTKNNLAHVIVQFVKGSGSKDKSVLMCPLEHETPQKAEFFCQSCKKVICALCGMMYHRDPTEHQTFPIGEKLAKMEEDLRLLLEWGKNEEREQIERKESLELKQPEVTTSFMAVEAEIDHTFAEERKHLEDRQKNLKQNLWDIKRAIKTALQKRCNVEEEAAPISDLNCLTGDILEEGAGAVMEMHEEIVVGYQSQKQRVAQNETIGALQQLSVFLSDIRFHQESKKEMPVIGTIVSNTGNWMLEQVRFGVHLDCSPSSIIELSNGLVAVGFSRKSNIELFDCSGQRYRPVRPMAVKDMAPLSDDRFLVLDQDGDVVRVSASQNNRVCLLKQDKDLPEVDRPRLIAANGSKYALLYEDRVQSYSKGGVLEHVVRLPLDLGDKLCRMQFHRNGSGASKYSDCNLEILMGDGPAVSRLHCNLSQSPPVISSNIVLLDQRPALGRTIGYTADQEVNLYIAYTRDDEFITIKKYLGGDLSKDEVVIADLQVMMNGGGTILLASLSPLCLVMCTSKKLSFFKKGTVDDFLHGIGLA